MIRIRTKVKSSTICWFFLALFWILENLAPHSISSQIGMVIMLATIGCYCFQHKRIKISPVLISYCALILLQFFYCICGFVLLPSVTMSDIQTMVICLICGIVMYTFLYIEGTSDKIGNFFIYTGLISLIIVMFLCRNSLLTGRMAHAYGAGSVSYYFLGKPVSISSNGIATYSCFGFFFALLKYSKDKRIKWLLCDVIFILGVILTGSRKGILMLGAFWVIYELIIKKNGTIVLKTLGIVLVVTLGYLMVTRIEVLRNIIGARLQALLVNLLTGQAVSEGSMTARARYASYAREIIQNKYLFGNGLGWFKAVYGNVTENNYYDLIVGCGIFGLIINYLFVIDAAKKIYKYRKNKECLAMGAMLAILLILQWGSVVYMTRNILIYESLLYLFVRYHCAEADKNE